MSSLNHFETKLLEIVQSEGRLVCKNQAEALRLLGHSEKSKSTLNRLINSGAIKTKAGKIPYASIFEYLAGKAQTK